MITLITGVPGAGKSLYALCHTKARAEKESRPVLYNGIKGLKLPWSPLDDPEKWMEAAEGAIIVIDECQRVFRPRGTGAAVPPYVSALETHRHRGLDIVLITQHPMLVDSNIRRLVGQHFHVVRKFGTKFATVHEWATCTEISKGATDESVKHEFRYPVEAFGWYESAEIHTHKRNIPAKVWFLIAAPFIIAGCAWFAWRSFSQYTEKKKASEPTAAASSAAAATVGAAPVVSAHQYMAQFRPRVQGLPHTAPAYDEVTKVSRAPVPAACVSSKSRCQCYTQDGTKVDMEPLMCADIIEKGFFIPFEVKASASSQQQQSASRPAPAAAAPSGVAAAQPTRAPGVSSPSGTAPGKPL